MTAPRYTRITTALLLATRRDAALPEPPEASARAAAIAAIENAIRAKARARTRNKALAFAAAAAVVLGIGVAASVARVGAGATVAIAHDVSFPMPAPVVHAEGDGVEVVDRGEQRAETEAAPVTQGQRLVARPKGRALLAFATGTELLLEERGDLTVQEGGASQRFALGGGSMSAKVAKLEAGQRFIVATPDAEVEVRGTAFRVSVVGPDSSCGAKSKTRVEVTEGTVVIRHGGTEARVSAGQSWPTDCTAASAPAPAPAPTLTPAPAASPAPAAAPASQLAEQNDLFAEAIAAKRRGASAQAVAVFDRFLAKYPSSALAESALAERMKLLRTPAAAKQYLARYPNGFARAEAHAILGE